MFVRHLDQILLKHFQEYREIMVLLGARQTGKTTILKRLFPMAQYLLVDNEPVRQALETYDINVYKQILNRQKESYVVIDEIQLLSNPGRCAKIIFDELPKLKLIITGSSSLHIKNKTGESLAGRKRDYYLYPLTFSEYLVQNEIEPKLNFCTSQLEKDLTSETPTHLFNLKKILEDVLLYGLFPQMVNYPQDRSYLENFGETLVFKDLMELNLIDNRRGAYNLLKLLAYQTGNLINYYELAGKLGLDQRTVRRYLDIFEQSFIIFGLYPFSQRKRDEIVKSPKIYFWDTGLRNAIIGNFDSLSLRADNGALFENFIIAEYKKALNYQNSDYQVNYWRTKQGAEIDLVLSRRQELIGREIKLNKRRASLSFKKRYPQAQSALINSRNFY